MNFKYIVIQNDQVICGSPTRTGAINLTCGWNLPIEIYETDGDVRTLVNTIKPIPLDTQEEPK